MPDTKRQVIRPTPLDEGQVAPREKIIVVRGGEESGGGSGDRPVPLVTGAEASGVAAKIEPLVSGDRGEAGGVGGRKPPGRPRKDGRPAGSVPRKAVVNPGVRALMKTEEGLVPVPKGAGRRPLLTDEEIEAAWDDAEEKRSPYVYEVNVRLGPEGTMLPARAERLVLGLADGFTELEAWRMAEGKGAGYRNQILAHPVFKARLEILVSEKNALDAAGIGGEMIWAAKQNLRVARLGGDPAQIQRATFLFIDTATKVGGFNAGGGSDDAPAAGADAPRGPGRPPITPRQLKNVDIESMRSRLTNMGMKAPAE